MALTLPKIDAYMRASEKAKNSDQSVQDHRDSEKKEPSKLHPMSMTQMEKIFSLLVFGEMLPKPTLVKLLNVKYKAVMYFDFNEGPPMLLLML